MPVSYISPHGPQKRMRPASLAIGGWPLKNLRPIGMAAGAFGGVALLAVIFLGEGMPRMQRDVLRKIPVIGDYWDESKRAIPASDNPF